MADAYAKLTGKPGILMVTRGPGATNASIGVHTAHQDSTPMVVLIGQVGAEFRDREAFQEIDYRRFYGADHQMDGADRRRSSASPNTSRRRCSAPSAGAWGRSRSRCLRTCLSPAQAMADDARRYARCRHAPAARPDAPARADASAAAQVDRWCCSAAAAGRGRPATPGGVRRNGYDLPTACVFRRQDLLDNDHPQLHRRRRHRRQPGARRARARGRSDSRASVRAWAR